MRAMWAIACLCALAGCGDRRSFEDKYRDTSAELEQRARALDQNIANDLPAEEAGNSRQ